jgi:hypothetical protein
MIETRLSRAAWADLVPEPGAFFTWQGLPFTGIAEERYAGGMLKSETLFWRGVPQRVEQEWHPNGQRASLDYFPDRATWEKLEWYGNGSLRTRLRYLFNALVLDQRYDEDGKPHKDWHLDTTSPLFEKLLGQVASGWGIVSQELLDLWQPGEVQGQRHSTEPNKDASADSRGHNGSPGLSDPPPPVPQS